MSRVTWKCFQQMFDNPVARQMSVARCKNCLAPCSAPLPIHVSDTCVCALHTEHTTKLATSTKHA